MQLNNPMEVLKLLDKSNCGECGQKTCMAFAAAVARGLQGLDECPRLDQSVIEKFGNKPVEPVAPEQDIDAPLEEMKACLKDIDFPSAAERLGADYSDGKLTVKVCGKDFSVDKEGNFYSEIHIHSWITGPVLNYILERAGKPVSGEWVAIRELKGGRDWDRFFEHKCVKPIKKVADTYPDLFEDMLHIFNGKKVENHYEADISLVLYPLPKVPILFCYWEPEDGLGSSLNLFFDKTADDNLDIKFIYSLGTGFAIMFEKIALRHGY